MAIYTKLEGTSLVAREQMLQSLKSKFIQQVGGNTPMVIRTLRPEDLGLTGSWSFATGATGWVTYINSVVIANNTFIGINGVRNLTTTTPQAVTQIRITREGNVARYWDIQGINQFDNPEAFFDDPITVDQNTTIKLECYSIASATEKLVLIGDVVEKRGILINPPLF